MWKSVLISSQNIGVFHSLYIIRNVRARKNWKGISWSSFCLSSFWLSKIQWTVTWMLHYRLAMVSSSLNSFVRSRTWKSGCYLKSFLWKFLLQCVTRRLHMLSLDLVEKSVISKENRQSVTNRESIITKTEKKIYKGWQVL